MLKLCGALKSETAIGDPVQYHRVHQDAVPCRPCAHRGFSNRYPYRFCNHYRKPLVPRANLPLLLNHGQVSPDNVGRTSSNFSPRPLFNHRRMNVTNLIPDRVGYPSIFIKNESAEDIRLKMGAFFGRIIQIFVKPGNHVKGA